MKSMEAITQSSPAPVLRIQTFFYTHAHIAASEQHSAILRFPIGQLKTTEFRYFLAQRIPLVVTGLNRKIQLSWSPSDLIRDYGTDLCLLEDCEEQENAVKKPLKTFLIRFMNSEAHQDPSSDAQDILPSAVWRIKVWMRIWLEI
jgi:lysine-specific demethylase 3